jgi:DUF4097 and DUF4098 domain-containing protein YvlB
MRSGLTAITAVLATLGAAPAAAQDADVHVHVAVSPQVARELRREVSQNLGAQVGRDIRGAVRDVLSGLADLGHLDAGAAQDREFRAEQTDRQTRTLNIGATGSLDLKNVSGDVAVTAGGGRTATVEITRTSRGRTDADAKQGLSQVTVDVNQSGERATVQTRYPDSRRPPFSVSVSYKVTAPAGTHLTIGSVSGDVHVTGIHGDLSVNVVSGDVTVADAGRVALAKTISGDVTISNATTDAGIETGSISGNISLRQVRARRITASVISGSVTAQDVTCDAAQIGTTDGDVTYVGPLARRGRYELKSFSGDVHFAPAGGVGFELEASTFSGRIQLEPPLTLHDATTSRRSMRGTVGDGGAAVTITTFSGDVRITSSR